MTHLKGGFAENLIDRTDRFGPLCVGLDPYDHLIPAWFGPQSIATIERFCGDILDLLVGKVGIVKPQMALFERWGAEGLACLARLCAKARAQGMLVILDAKRGDIGATAEAYAQAYLGARPAIAVDCLTIHPYMGLDSMEPFFAQAEANGKGVAVLVRTSNPGAHDFQMLDIAPDADRMPERLWETVARGLDGVMNRLQSSGHWSSLMVVAGATAPAEARRLRQILPRSLFLVPGFGAQGADARAALAGFVARPIGESRPDAPSSLDPNPPSLRWQGGVVNASRSILFPPAAALANDPASWRIAIARAIDDAKVQFEQVAFPNPIA